MQLCGLQLYGVHLWRVQLHQVSLPQGRCTVAHSRGPPVGEYVGRILWLWFGTRCDLGAFSMWLVFIGIVLRAERSTSVIVAGM
jgi:hypothetical protein